MPDTLVKIARRGRPRLTPPALPPLPDSAEPVEARVYASLRKALMEGAFPLGARFSGRGVADALGVSQMPVREALKRLESNGAVQGTAKSAFVVPSMSAEQYRELVAIRVELEGMVCRNAAPRIDEDTLRDVRALADRILGSQDWRNVLRDNFRMHFLIYGAAQMPFALAMIESLWLRVGPALNEIGSAGDVQTSAASYPSLLAALEARDGVRAEQALVSDILSNADVVIAQLEQRRAASVT